MKFIATKGLKVVSSTVGNPDMVELSDLERAAWCLEAAKWGAWVPSTTDFKSLPDNTTVNVQSLWNWDGSEGQFGVVRVEPVLGYIITLASSDLQKVVGAQLLINWNFINQSSAGYAEGGGYFPYAVQHNMLLELTKEEQGSTMIGIIPGQMVNGRAALSLGLVNANTSNLTALNTSLKITGLPAGTTANVRIVTRHDPDLHRLWPDAYAILHEHAPLLGGVS